MRLAFYFNFILILLQSIVTWGQHEKLDSLEYHVLSLDINRTQLKSFEDYLDDTLGGDEIDQVLTSIRTFFGHEEQLPLELSNQGINIEKYILQIVPMQTKNDNQIIWINCVCKEQGINPIHKKLVLITRDGGGCYFSFFYSPKKNELFDFLVNGF